MRSRMALHMFLHYHQEEFPARYMRGRFGRVTRMLYDSEIRRIREMLLAEPDPYHTENFKATRVSTGRPRTRTRSPIDEIMRRAMGTIIIVLSLTTLARADDSALYGAFSLAEQANTSVGYLLELKTETGKTTWPWTQLMKFTLDFKDRSNVNFQWTEQVKPGAIIPLCLFVLGEQTIVVNPCPGASMTPTGGLQIRND